jgi:demethylmenaquinone methyltransferase/2-methoxy-6-polyprenyl-1,4-benzoquinol methylase
MGIAIFANLIFSPTVTQLQSTKTEVKPYESDASKREQVEQMFDSISHRYDFLNHFLSLGIDNIWRKRAIGKLKSLQPKRILDVATGTADLAIAALALNPDKIVGVDISNKMLDVGRAKIAKRGLDKIELKNGDSENLPFEDNSFDAITVAFGVRNYQNLEAGLNEMKRILRPGGKLVVLEFSKPSVFPIKQIFNFYSKYILPIWGKLLSGSTEAYVYLPESVKHFPEGEEFTDILQKCGYQNTNITRLTFGISSIYEGTK